MRVNDKHDFSLYNTIDRPPKADFLLYFTNKLQSRYNENKNKKRNNIEFLYK